MVEEILGLLAYAYIDSDPTHTYALQYITVELVLPLKIFVQHFKIDFCCLSHLDADSVRTTRPRFDALLCVEVNQQPQFFLMVNHRPAAVSLKRFSFEIA